MSSGHTQHRHTSSPNTHVSCSERRSRRWKWVHEPSKVWWNVSYKNRWVSVLLISSSTPTDANRRRHEPTTTRQEGKNGKANNRTAIGRKPTHTGGRTTNDENANRSEASEKPKRPKNPKIDKVTSFNQTTATNDETNDVSEKVCGANHNNEDDRRERSELCRLIVQH